jgi:uncharacterized protein (TIGR02996 family)
MDPGKALFQAILDEPDDDAPRLVYADWLEENGQPERAEFIRVQIELVKPPAGGRRRARLKAREEELLKKRGDEWLKPLLPFTCDIYSDPCEFRRGFVERMDLESESFVEHAAEIFRLTPLRVGRFPDQEDYKELAACPYLARFRELDFTMSGLSDNFAPHVLITSNYLKDLEVLRLCGYDDNCHLDVPGLEALSRARYLTRLRELDLSNNWFGDEGVEALARTRRLPALEHLSLEGVGMTDRGVLALAASPLASRLQQLDLAANDIGTAGAQVLVNTPALAGLKRLDLRDNALLDPAARRALRVRFGKAVLL